LGSGGGATALENTLATAQMAWRMDVSGKPGAVEGRHNAASKEGRCKIRVAWGTDAKKTSMLGARLSVSWSGTWGSCAQVSEQHGGGQSRGPGPEDVPQELGGGRAGERARIRAVERIWQGKYGIRSVWGGSGGIWVGYEGVGVGCGVGVVNDGE